MNDSISAFKRVALALSLVLVPATGSTTTDLVKIDQEMPGLVANLLGMYEQCTTFEETDSIDEQVVQFLELKFRLKENIDLITEREEAREEVKETGVFGCVLPGAFYAGVRAAMFTPAGYPSDDIVSSTSGMSEEELEEKSLSVVIAYFRFDGLDLLEEKHEEELQCLKQEWITVPVTFKRSIAGIRVNADKEALESAIDNAFEKLDKDEQDAAEEPIKLCLP